MKHFPTILLVCAMAAPAVAGDWRQFRGTDNTSVSDEAGLPTTFDAAGGQNVAWKAPLPGRGASGPIIVGGRVFVTASGGSRQERLHVLCFDAASGKVLWQRQFWGTGSTVVNGFSAGAAPTPASDGQRVFALFSSCDLACFDLEGNLLWFRGLGFESPTTRNDVGMASSPLVVDQTLVVQLQNQGESFVAGIDTTTGATRWRIERDHSAIWSSPTVLRGKAPEADRVLLQGRQVLSAHDPKDGRQLWAHEAMVDTIGSATTCGETIYLPAVGLQSLQPEPSGQQVRRLWYQDRLRVDNPSTIGHGKWVYFLKPPGILVCANAADGQMAWQLRLKGPIWATPVLADGRLYVVNHDGLVQVVELSESGQEPGKLVGAGQLESGVLASPAVADRAIYFRTNASLWKVAKKQ